MIFLIGIINVGLIYLYYFRESFVAELAISFIPYIIGFCIISIFIEIFFVLHQSKRNIKHKTACIFSIILVTILTTGIGILYSSEYFGFYNQPDEAIRLRNNEEGIKVFYANILYKNTDYKSLQKKIEQEDPDIVIMVEFSDNHEDEMKEFFKENYPYMNRNSRSTMLAGDVVFSKIPLENITETHLVDAGARNYSYMKIQCENCGSGADLYVIHTAAPVSLKNFYMRNAQLLKFKSDFSSSQDTSNPVIIIGDFNLSPWSYYYSQLTNNRDMLNALSYQSPNYTWSLYKQKIFRSHIDQIFTSEKINISEIVIEDLPGSDHRSFTFYFGIDQ